MSNISQFSELLADLRESAEYWRELGCERMNVAELTPLPEFSAEPSILKSVLPDEPQLPVRQPVHEKAAPPEDIIRQVRGIQPTRQSAPPSRLGLLQETKISSVTNVPRNPPPPRAEKPIMKKQENAPTDLKGSMFGDITKALPETGETIDSIREEIGRCTRCPLNEGRTQVVHSTGNRTAELMFIGEAPGADEDEKGEPFVGRAGQLLTKIIEAMGLRREDVFIGNINRCRPPGNRAPTLPEAHTCRPFLLREIAVVRPKVIVVLGNTACQNLLDTKVGITKLRGNFQDYFGVRVMPTFHPAYLLRDPSKKREVWEDMKIVRDYLSSLQKESI